VRGDENVLAVDILAKVLVVHELHKKRGLDTNTVSHEARLFVENFDARLAGIFWSVI